MTDVSQTKVAAAPGREERIKLRSACDRCSLNKIKCSQDKPECQRCKTIGAQCHYSRSMRMGKPRKSAKAKAMMNAKLPGKPEPVPAAAETNDAMVSNHNHNIAIANAHHSPGSNSEQQHVVPTTELPWSADWSFDSLLAAHDHMAASGTSGSAADPFRGLFDQHPHDHHNCNNGNAVVSTADIMNVDAMSAGYSQSGHSDDAFLSFPQSPLSLQKPMKDEPENVYLSPSSYYAPSFESTLLSTGSSSPFEDLGPSLLSQPNSHDCTHLALETLTSLCLPSTVQRTAEGQPRPTIDQVLKINSEAVKNVSTILSCSCAKDSSFPMLLSTILSKALAWYRAAVESHESTLDDNSNNVKEEIVHRPISVGGYELDDESSDLMKIQLVLNRLRMMSKPVKQYIETYAGSAASQPISPPSTAGSPNEIKTSTAALSVGSTQLYATMGTFIQGNLQSAIDELQAKLVLMGGHL